VVRIENVKDPDQHVQCVLDRVKHSYLARQYQLSEWIDVDDFLCQLAKRSGRLLKGGEPDTQAVAKMVLNDWQRGKLPFYVKPPGCDENDKSEVKDMDTSDAAVEAAPGASLPVASVETPNQGPNVRQNLAKIVVSAEYSEVDDVRPLDPNLIGLNDDPDDARSYFGGAVSECTELDNTVEDIEEPKPSTAMDDGTDNADKVLTDNEDCVSGISDLSGLSDLDFDISSSDDDLERGRRSKGVTEQPVKGKKRWLITADKGGNSADDENSKRKRKGQRGGRKNAQKKTEYVLPSQKSKRQRTKEVTIKNVCADFSESTVQTRKFWNKKTKKAKHQACL